MIDPLSASLADVVRDARAARGLSASALAEASGVSRAMIAKIERAEVQPTAALLGRLSAALGLTLSELVARAEDSGRRLARGDDQPVWTDPETGYRRRALSPVSGGPLELVEVELPPGAEVSYPADACVFSHQQLYMLEGRLRLIEGDTAYELEAGDCLQFGPPAPTAFVNATARRCRYLVALVPRS